MSRRLRGIYKENIMTLSFGIGMVAGLFAVFVVLAVMKKKKPQKKRKKPQKKKNKKKKSKNYQQNEI